jgi:D-glycero-D-manno-heptose 1,7-bisphosphate phosphatase
MFEPGIFGRYRLFIFDADDTLRRTIVPGQPCPRGPEQWVLLPKVQQKLARVAWNQPDGPMLGIASNQDQVAYGHLSLETARELLRDLARAAAGVEPANESLQLCPHPSDFECSCRKPAPGMLKAIVAHYGVAPEETLFVGNHEVDREAAARAAVAFASARDFFGWSELPNDSLVTSTQQL